MKSVRPKSFDVASVKLSAEEGFVLSRVEGTTSLDDLVSLTGLPEDRVAEIVAHLAAEGALHIEGASESVPESASESESESESASESESESESAPESDADATSDPTDSRAVEGEREYRKIYETVFRTMARDLRAARATTAEGGELMALCLDPEPQVIAGVLANPKSGLEHARAIAFHHRTAAGLDLCGRRNEMLADATVQRRLLKNPQLPDTVLRKILHPKQLLDVYRISLDRENPERSRVKTREHLRKKFTLSSADERAALLVKTDGRAFAVLAGCPIDAHTTQILCQKTTFTILFVQNVARFSAAPPALLVHLLKQPLVRRNMGLRKMLLQHHNTPAEAKKSF